MNHKLFALSQRAAWWEGAFLIMGLALFALQALTVSPHKSAAFDEQYHLTAGYSYLRTGDFRLATTHPPLMGMIGATALLQDQTIVLPLDHPAWQAGDRFLFSDVFLWEANANPQAILVAARRLIIGMGLLLVLLLYVWARQLWGRNGALLVLLLAVFDPNLLANARVVTTDLGLSCFLALATWRLWRWLVKPSWPNLLLTGLAAGLAMSAKYTGLLFWPAALLLILLYPRQSHQPTRGQRLLALVGMGLTAYGVIWAVYHFDFGVMQDGPISFPIPAPFYWQQLWWSFNRIVDLQAARLDFFWGEAGFGWWNYFPVALGLKTPLPLLILATLGLWEALRSRQGHITLVLWTLPLLFLLLGMSGVLTIGYRHLLPAIPLLIVQAGGAVALFESCAVRQRLAYGALAVLLLWFIASVLRVYPHQDAYFNELAGDWPQWSSYLVDSNLDWGQDLPALHDWMTAHGVERVNLAYFGKAVPEVYGVQYQPLPGYLRFVEGVELNAYNPVTPEPGWYAISATSLRLGLMQPATVDLYAFFRDQKPVGRAGYSIYLYQVSYPADLPVERLVVFGQAAAQLPAAELGSPTGAALSKRVQVKWVQSPETALYPLGQGFTPSNENYHPLAANFADVFTLLGYSSDHTSARPGETVTFTLVWRKGPAPMPMPAPTRGNPLSMFLHVTGAEPGQIVSQFDGWRTALRGLEEGDMIVMPAAIELGSDVPPDSYILRLGLYSPQSGARLPVGEADHVQIGTLEVTP